MTRLIVAPRFKHKGASTSVFFAVVVSVVIVALVVSALMVPSPTSNTAPNTNSGSKANGNQTTTSISSSRIQPASPTSVSCVTVVPYDSIQKEFAGCGYTFSVLYNGAPGPLQTLPNGTEEINLGWTLLIHVSQNCRCGPSQNVTVGWDPGGPGSSSSGERLPAPASSTLLNGNLTMEWRLYGSNVPLLYAWIIASSITSSSPQTTSATTRTSCPASPWPSQISTGYQPVIQQIEQNPAFVALTDGRCYSFTLNDFGTSGGQSLTTFIFNQYNGTLFYPCGTFPANLTISQIQVTVFNGTTTDEISSMWLNNQTASLNVYNCPLATTPVLVHSVLIVPPYTPAGPTVKIILYANLEQQPITNLMAVLALTGREPFQSQTQTFEFLGVNASKPLLAGQSISQSETIVGPVTIYSNHIYSMNISGAFQNGQTFSSPVQVEIQNSPSPGSVPPTTSSSTSSSLSVPPPTTTITHYGCGISSTTSSRASALVLVNTSRVSNLNVDVSVSPALSLDATACSYTYTNTTTPTACGVMCGGGIGYTYAVSYVWKLNFSLSSSGVPGDRNLTIASGTGMSELLPLLGNQIYLNSQQITSWYSTPPCYGREGIESNCMLSNATSIVIELPSSIQSGDYQLVVSSEEYLVP